MIHALTAVERNDLLNIQNGLTMSSMSDAAANK